MQNCNNLFEINKAEIAEYINDFQEAFYVLNFNKGFHFNISFLKISLRAHWDVTQLLNLKRICGSHHPNPFKGE